MDLDVVVSYLQGIMKLYNEDQLFANLFLIIQLAGFDAIAV